MSKPIFTTAEVQDRTLSTLAIMILALGAAMLVSAGTHLSGEGGAELLGWLEKVFAVAAIVFALLGMVPWMRSRGESCGPEVEGFLSEVAKRSLNTSWFITLAFAFLILGRLGSNLPAAFYKDAIIGVMLTCYAISFMVINFRAGKSADGN